MTDYTKATNFAVKDGLPSGNPAKLIKGTEIDTEFTAIQTAVATKADKISPVLSGTVTLTSGTNISTNGTTISDVELSYIDGVTSNIQSQLNGKATINNVPVDTHAATSKATPVDADELPLADSAASFGLKKLTWANLKATLKTYLDTLYAGKGTNSDITSLNAMSGNLNFTATGNRITGDMTNATFASRVMVQSSTTNGTSTFGAIPNGTGTSGGFMACNAADPDNASWLAMSMTSSEARFTSSKSGTGTAYDFGWYCGSSIGLTLKADRSALQPGGDNITTCGASGARWSVVWAATGTISTSDARLKTPVSPLSDREKLAAIQMSKEIGTYQWLSSIAEKGDKARHHVGLTVQRAIEIMESHGLDPFSYGFICFDKWEDEFTHHEAEYDSRPTGEIDEHGNEVMEAIETKPACKELRVPAGDRYSFRYDELNLFIASGIESRLTALESKYV